MFSLKDDDFENAIDQSLLRNELKIVWKNGYIERQQIHSLDPKARLIEQNRLMRAKLKSSDGNTVEIHDQVQYCRFFNFL